MRRKEKRKAKRRRKWFICFVVLAKSLKSRPLNIVEQLAKAFAKTLQHIKSLSCTLNYTLQSRVQNQPCFVWLSGTLERCLGWSEYGQRPLGCLKEVVLGHAK